jgi:hypothetical protein
MAKTVQVALDLAATGLPVFPCGRKKQPSISKKDGGRGFLDAVTEQEAVKLLFWRAPRAAMVGVPTGPSSGFDVLDVDYRNGGGMWEEANKHRLPDTRIHTTLQGGRHYLFLHAPGVRNSASKVQLAPGIDIRGEGGYIIHPPSNGYSVANDVPIVEWPDWLLQLVLARPEKERAPAQPPSNDPVSTTRADRYCEAIVRKVSSAPLGSKHVVLRNTALLIGGLLHLTTWSAEQAQRRLVEALPSTVEDWNTAKATAAWGIAQGQTKRIDGIPDREEWRRQQPPRQSVAKPLNGHAHALAIEPPLNDPRLPVIRVQQGFRHKAADEGMDAMRKAGVEFYQRDRSLVRAALSKAKTADGAVIEVPSLIQVAIPVLSRALGQSAEWERVNKDGEPIRIDPPKEVVEQIAVLSGHWPFPPVAGVIGTPTMRPDGSLLMDPGYDAATGLVLVSPPAMPPLPEPTLANAQSALGRLIALLAEFPFADTASRSAALSMLLTPVLRGALGAAVPMHVVAAPQPGTGKSYLQDVASVLATGERCAVITVAPDPNETEKRLIGAALAGFPIIALDNCNGTLTGDFLAQVTERPLLQLRPLGSSGVQRIANVFSVFANGNNIAVSADLVRRSILCSLDANMEDPERREFKKDPVETILQHRGAYLVDCLTIAKSYHEAGYPGRAARIPSFERWSDLVRSALIWLGQTDPVNNSDVIKAEDPDRSARNAVFSAWCGPLTIGTPYTTGDIIRIAEDFDTTRSLFVNADLRSSLLDVAKSKNSDRIDPKRLGWWFRNACKVVVGNRKLLRDDTNRDEVLRWKMHELRAP